MILKGKKRNTNNLNVLVPIALVLIVLVLLGIKINLFKKSNTKDGTTILSVYCGAESIKEGKFINGNDRFNGANTQSAEKSRTGKFSSKLDRDNKYGITYQLKEAKPGKTYKVEVWTYSKTATDVYLAVSGENPKAENFYLQENNNIENDGNWWIKHELYFTLPVQYPVENVKVYVYKSEGKSIVYCDDFKIEEQDSKKALDQTAFSPDKLIIQIDKEGLDKLEKIKKKAYVTGLLIQSPDDEINARILYNNEFIKAKIRYKGDWLDHLMGGTPSFRVKLNSKKSWNGLQTFSIQHPKTRGYLMEWVFHEFLKRSDVLTPRYDFIYFKINDNKTEIRAIEEHFTKNLVENQLRREGPIIKLVEDRFWEGMKRAIKYRRKLADAENKEKAFWSSEIKPFKEKRTIKNTVLNTEFKIAQNLLYQYKYGLKKPSEIFDIDRLAKFLVITDICMAYHSLTWHNQRFYYNPVTSLLEPIGYDGHGSPEAYPLSHPIKAESVYHQTPYSTEPIERVFYDDKFIKKYIKYLYEFSQPKNIKSFISQIEEPLRLREKLLQTSKKEYKYNVDDIINRAFKIQESILPFSNSLQVFRKEINGDSSILQFYNSHILPLEIVNIGKHKSQNHKEFGKGVIIYPQNQREVPQCLEIKVPSWVTHVFYKLPGIDSIFVKPISSWSSPENWSPRSDLVALSTINKGIYEENNNIIVFPKSDYEITKPLVISHGKKVIIEAGTKFSFSKKGFFFSFSSVDIRGDQDEPVIIESIDGKAGSFTVMQAKEKSLFRHVIFKGQNTLNYSGWNLSGGVSLYESDCDFIACQFLDNNCEDALNIIRSNFTINKCSFYNIYSDAFDADFCKGQIKNTRFLKVKNDALDFSTSNIEVLNCIMDQIGDKGISAGEQSTLFANKIIVKNANIAFASKDLSTLTLDNIAIQNCKKGIVAYKKKPEYGPAKIVLKKYKFVNTNHQFMIEKGCVLEKQ